MNLFSSHPDPSKCPGEKEHKKHEAESDEFQRNSSGPASYFLCSFSLGHLDESGWDENKWIVLVPPRITLLSTRKSTFRDEKNQSSFPFHSGNPTTFSSIFNFQFSDSMTSASVSASKPLLLLFHSAISLSLINQAFFLFSRSFSGLEKELGRAWEWDAAGTGEKLR